MHGLALHTVDAVDELFRLTLLGTGNAPLVDAILKQIRPAFDAMKGKGDKLDRKPTCVLRCNCHFKETPLYTPTENLFAAT